MLLNGERLYREVSYFEVARKVEDPQQPGVWLAVNPYRIRVRALGPGWGDDAYRLLPRPEPPKTGQYMDNGSIRDRYDEKDTAYLERLLTWERALLGKKIYDGTQDPGVQWEAPVAQCEKDPAAFYGAIWEEAAAWLGRGELERWALRIDLISSIGGADIAVAESEFFRGAAGAGGLPATQAAESREDAVQPAVPGAPDLQGNGGTDDAAMASAEQA